MKDYNPKKRRRVLVLFDDVIADMKSNKKLSPILMNCFLRRKECNILLVFKSQFTSLLHHNNFKMTKSIRLNATRYSIKKIANKSEL